MNIDKILSNLEKIGFGKKRRRSIFRTIKKS